MMTYESLKTVNACRFCWMCRHLCPVGLATGKENNGPRVKAMFLDMNEKRGGLEAETALDMYECALCNACAANCETGYEPAVYIREARSILAADGLVPPKVERVIGQLDRSGNLYGADLTEAVQQPTDASNRETAVYIGATMLVKAPENKDAFLSLLAKAGIEVQVFSGACGSAAAEYDLLGDVAEVHAAAEKCAEQLNASGARKLVVLDPSDAVMFKQQYPAWGIRLNMEVVTATSFVEELIKNEKLKISPQTGRVTYHDPCRLARDLDETEAARNIISAMGYELKEMLQSRKLTRCCGGQVLAAHSPEITGKMAEARTQEAVRTGASILVTACPGCTANLGGTEKIQVKDLFVLLDACVK